MAQGSPAKSNRIEFILRSFSFLTTTFIWVTSRKEIFYASQQNVSVKKILLNKDFQHCDAVAEEGYNLNLTSSR